MAQLPKGRLAIAIDLEVAGSGKGMVKLEFETRCSSR